jgi:hypothetical protein
MGCKSNGIDVSSLSMFFEDEIDKIFSSSDVQRTPQWVNSPGIDSICLALLLMGLLGQQGSMVPILHLMRRIDMVLKLMCHQFA